MDAFEPTSRAEALMREQLYELACTDLGSMRLLVKQNERMPFYPNTLPPKAQMRQLPLGEMFRRQDELNYLRALVAEADQLIDMLPRLAARLRISRNHNDYEKTLEFARYAVRSKELSVDWELTVYCEKDNEEGKEILQNLSDPAYPNNLTANQIQILRDEIKVWDDGYPAVKAAWDAVVEKSAFTAGMGMRQQ
ncbi:hypothetical protein F4819DRAFT_504178 [Hypoxylon fuscum]|nr:hypothetical protein F4819DRAFT_504178 [Hypoxylon fuscum]